MDNNKFGPKNTIDHNEATAWLSKSPSEMIEYSFDSPRHIALIKADCFSGDSAPKEIVISGSISKDCKNLQELLKISNARYTETSKTKTWLIPDEKQKILSCVKLEIKSTKGDKGAALTSVSMWENFDNGEY